MPATWHRSLLVLYAAAAALITDTAGRGLLVKPNYQDHCSLLGGICETHTERDASLRQRAADAVHAFRSTLRRKASKREKQDGCSEGRKNHPKRSGACEPLLAQGSTQHLQRTMCRDRFDLRSHRNSRL